MEIVLIEENILKVSLFDLTLTLRGDLDLWWVTTLIQITANS